MSGPVMLSVRPIVSDPATNDAMNNNQENQTIPFITAWLVSLTVSVSPAQPGSSRDLQFRVSISDFS